MIARPKSWLGRSATSSTRANACAFFVLPDVLDAITVIYTLARETLRTTVFEDSRALRKFTYHHEGHEEHEVRNEISTNLLTFVAFVSFVVRISVFFGCGSPALGSSW
jgi:hypothetical protein